MTRPTLADRLGAAVREAAARASLTGEVEPVVPCTNPAHGDWQSNAAFRLAKAAGLPPRVAAERLVAALDAPGLVAAASVAGPGFVNLRVDDDALAADIAARAAPDLASPQPGAGRTMVIDYSSPNVAKRMHVGHLRSTVIGNALDRLHRFLGWTVIADNHIGDWGTQFGKLIVGWERWRDESAFSTDPIAELQRLYQRFGERVDDEPDLLEVARARTAALQAGDPELRALWRRFVDQSLVEFDAVYARLGVKFDVTLGESSYEDRLADLVAGLCAGGVAELDQGAVLIRFGPDDGPGLGDSVLLLRKSDGAVLYGATDLATLEHRQKTWNPELVVYVVDARQALHFRQLFAAWRRLGGHARLEHVGFGVLRLPGGDVASTKKGAVVPLVDVLDTAARRARAVVDARSDGLSEDERAHVAEAVGTSAIKYFDLSQNPASDITFDWDRSLALEGNTAPYLMYAYARCRSLMRKAGDLPEGSIRLTEPAERDLALHVARMPDAIRAAAAALRPNLLADHVYATTAATARFWENCRVLGDDVPADVAASRLALVRATAAALHAGLRLLGLEPLERM
jgi:arginyl-tRNA synthetase